jgi:hypothetical protein
VTRKIAQEAINCDAFSGSVTAVAITVAAVSVVISVSTTPTCPF